jgi:hypothetical protein
MSAADPSFTAPSPATPPVMRAAASAYERARRLRTLAIAGVGGGGAALLAAVVSGVLAFLVGQRLQRR